MLNFPVGGNLIPCVPNLQISSFLGIWSVQVTSYWHYGRSHQKIPLSNVCIRECFIVSYTFFKKENSEVKLVFFSGAAAFLKSLFTTSSFFCFFFLLLCGCLSELCCVFWVCCMGIKQWCWFFISLSDTHLGSYLLKTWGFLGHSLGLQIGI